jgi:hypothetical protein
MGNLSDSSQENEPNPWESTWSQSDSSLQPQIADRCVVRFSGSLDRSAIAKFYGSNMQIGCVITLVLISALIWATILSVGFGVFGLLTVLIAVLIAMWYITGRYVGNNYANRLYKRRPWLEGPVHGVVTSGRLTVWHNDLCLQTNLRYYLSTPHKGMLVYPSPETVHPLAMIPSTCFFEDQWFDLHESNRHYRTFEPLISQTSPPDAHWCILSPERSKQLKARTRALNFRPNGGFLIGFAILGFWLGLSPEISGSTRSMVAFPVLTVVLLGWLASETIRYSWARFQAFRDFSDPEQGAYRKFNATSRRLNKPLDPSAHTLQSQWFNRQSVMISDLGHWVLVPVHYLQRVRVRDTWIEFRFADEAVLMHREGFENQDAWIKACQDALAIRQELEKNPRPRPRDTRQRETEAI